VPSVSTRFLFLSLLICFRFGPSAELNVEGLGVAQNGDLQGFVRLDVCPYVVWLDVMHVGENTVGGLKLKALE
jgi:hypothetical protein